MEINRNNYEEYFLLYADNELTDYEKIEVLKFIRENKDVEEEFKMIQDTICKPDINITLEDKSFLISQANNSFITEENYEEIFVLYNDGELTIEQKNKTELFIKQHPELKTEFDLFRNTKLEADTSIAFPGKQDLYKKEKAGRVTPLIFWRSMAAAVFLGFGIWIMQGYYQRQNAQPTVAVNVSLPKKNTSQLKTNSSISVIEKKDNGVAHTEKPKEKNSLYEINSKTKPFSKENVKEKVKENKDLVATPVKPVIKNTKMTAEKQDINVPDEKINNDVVISANHINDVPKINASTKVENTFTEGAEQKPLRTDDQGATQARTASYVNDANDKNENYVFYNITTEEFRKSKVGGFLKKVKRIVSRNNPITHLFSGEDKQVVSN